MIFLRREPNIAKIKKVLNPIYITKNGEDDLVVMSIEAFEQREETLKLRARLEAADRSRLAGDPTGRT